MLKIDGSYGEGGGQILRTALAASALLQKPFEITNIRAGRKKPGLEAQHLTGVRAVQEITDAKVEGDTLHSQYLKFEPTALKSGNFEFDVMKVRASAGSTGMIFQAVAPALGFAKGTSHLILKGGTHVAWSPPFHYLSEVFLPTIARMGFSTSLSIERWGWYPIGQGIVRVVINPVKELKSVDLSERGELIKISGISAVSRLPIEIAERQRNQGLKRLKELGLQAEIETVDAPSLGTGTFFFIVAEFENALAGFSSLGERGKRAEKVADEAIDEFIKYYNSGAAIEKRLADQLILYMALAKGKSTVTTSEISNHLLTNIWVVEKFLPVKFEIKGKLGEKGEVSVET